MNEQSKQTSWSEVIQFPIIWSDDWPKKEAPATLNDLKNDLFLTEVTAQLASNFDLETVPFGVLFNRVPSSLQIEYFGFSTRIYNSLNSNGWARPGDVLKLHIRQVRNFKHIGELKVRELLSALLTLQTRFAIDPDSQIESDLIVSLDDFLGSPSLEVIQERIEVQQHSQEILDAVSKISQFMEFCGASNQSLFEFIGKNKLYELEAFDFLKNLKTEKTTSKESLKGNLPSALAFFVNEFTDKEVSVFDQRVLAYPQPTLDAVGEILGITRERVRQLEVKIKARFTKLKSEDSVYQMLIAALDFRLSEPILKKLAISEMPVLREQFFGKYRILDLLLGLDELAQDGDWVMRDSKRVASEFHSVVENSLNPKWLPEISTWENLASLWPSFTRKTFKAWMTHSGYQLIIDHWVKNPSLIDFGYVALQSAKKPLSAQQIFDLAKSTGNVRTLENALAASAHFTRTGKKLWSLATWGNQQYKSIREAIEEIVDREGSIAFDQLVARLEEFGVKRSSVRAYATSAPFTIAGGFVRRTAAKRIVRKTIESTKNLYFCGEGVAYRFSINGEHLRGSGSTCPVALAKHLGVPDQGKVTFEGPHGQFRVSSRGHMYHLPSTREAIESLGLGLGDQMLLHFLDGQVVFSRVVTEGQADLQIRSILAVGREVDLAESLSHAFFNRFDATVQESIAACKKRGESDLAELIKAL
jgi:hypothetical protein